MFRSYWQNIENPDEMLFRTDDLAHAQQFIERVYAQTLKENSEANLPTMIFLKETN